MFDFTEKREYKGPMDPQVKYGIVKRAEERLFRNNPNLFVGYGVDVVEKPKEVVEQVVSIVEEVLAKPEVLKKKVVRMKKAKVVVVKENPIELVELPKLKVQFVSYESIFDMALVDAQRKAV